MVAACHTGGAPFALHHGAKGSKSEVVFVVVLRHVHGRHGLKAVAEKGCELFGGLFVRKMSFVGSDTLLDYLRVGSFAQHLRVVVAFEGEQSHVGEVGMRLRCHDSRVGHET